MPFPLQRLPDPALKHIFRCMTPLEIFAISLLSTKYLNLVKSMKVSAYYLDISLEQTLVVTVNFGNIGYFQIDFTYGSNGLDGTPMQIETSVVFEKKGAINVDGTWSKAPRVPEKSFANF